MELSINPVQSRLQTFFIKELQVRYIDASYAMQSDMHGLMQLISYHYAKNWIPPNKSYFPIRILLPPFI